MVCVVCAVVSVLFTDSKSVVLLCCGLFCCFLRLMLGGGRFRASHPGCHSLHGGWVDRERGVVGDGDGQERIP